MRKKEKKGEKNAKNTELSINRREENKKREGMKDEKKRRKKKCPIVQLLRFEEMGRRSMEVRDEDVRRLKSQYIIHATFQ